MRKEKARRRHIAIMLLTVYLSILSFSVFHVHHAGQWMANECQQCVNHVPHSGHLSASDGMSHVCLLCQFLSLNYVAATIVAFVYYTNVHKTYHVVSYVGKGLTTRGIIGLRAPPACFLR